MKTEELITQVDEHNKVLGLKPRSEFHDGKLIHRSSYLMLFNSKDELLLQKRSQSKKWHPGRYTYSVVGTVANESYEECLIRKMKEVFGFILPFKKLFQYSHFDNVDKAFKSVYKAETSQDNLAITRDYADSYLWMHPDELKRDMAEHSEKYAPPFITGMKIFFES